MNRSAIKLENVSKYYKLYNTPKDRLKEALHPFAKELHKKFYALKDVSLEIGKGEIWGIIGQNGSGKSTLLKTIAKILTPNTGSVSVNGSISALLELGVGFNPNFTGIENIYFYATILGLSKEDINERIEDILAFANIGEFINQPLKTYSSGMKARLGFAVATEINPDILIIDEVLAVGDTSFQRKCFARIESFVKKDKTILLVSHSRNSIVSLCDKAILLDHGRIHTQGEAEEVMRNYDILVNKKYLKKNIIAVSSTLQEESKDIGLPKAPKEDQNSEILFDESLKSEPIFFQSSKVNFNDFNITNLNKEKANILKTGEKYIINASFSFEEDLYDLQFALRIKTQQGILVSWVGYPYKRREYFHAKKGEERKISIVFDCNILDGSYTLDAGLQSICKDDIKTHVGYQDIYLIKINKYEYHEHGISFINIIQNMNAYKENLIK